MIVSRSRTGRTPVIAFAALVAFVALLAAGMPAFSEGQQSHSQAPTVKVADTISGPNFITYWKTAWIPAIEKKYGIKVEFTKASAPELQLQMKSWKQDQPEFNLFFIRGMDLSNMVVAGDPLESIYPAKQDQIPNESMEAKSFLPANNGVTLNGEGLIMWRCQFDLIFNTKYVKNPPKTWQEFYDRRAEFKGHIGIIRPDAGSAGGRAFIYSFLTAFGVDFSKPFAEVQKEPAWTSAWNKFRDFSSYFAQPAASSAPVLFHQFQTGQVWVTDYAQDYCLWSASQGALPPTTKASALDVNVVGASNAWLAVPKADSAAQKAAAYKVINYLISSEAQIGMLMNMYEYPGTTAWRQAPASIWQKLPRVDVAESHGIRITNFDAITYLKKHGMDYVQQ